MFKGFINRLVLFFRSKDGVAIIETSFIFPILIFLLIFFVEMHLFVQVRQSILILAYECARDFSISGRVNSFDKNIDKFTSVLLGIDNRQSLSKKLCYYIHLNSEIDNMCAYPLFFDVDGDGMFKEEEGDESLCKDEELLRVLKAEPEMFIGSKSYTIYNKSFNMPVPEDDEFCFWDEADNYHRHADMTNIKYGKITFIYKFNFIFPLFKHLILNDSSKLECVPIVCSAPIIRDF